MASTVRSGSYAIFAGVGSSTTSNGAFNSTMIDNLYAGKVPTSSGAVAYTWRRIFTTIDDSATLSREGTILDVKTQEEGLKKMIVSDVDKYTLEIPVADVIMQNFSELLILNTAYWSSSVSNTVTPISLSEVGKDMLSYGRPILIIDKAYQSLSTNASLDVPYMPSTGGDPAAMCFINGGLSDRNYSIAFNPKGQIVLNAKLSFEQKTGTTYTFAGAMGLLTASS